jgi:hypothetical protein
MQLTYVRVKQILPYFFVDRLTNDLDGAPQFYCLTDVPFDFGYNLIYLEINQLLGETFILRLYAYKKEKTTQFTKRE